MNQEASEATDTVLLLKVLETCGESLGGRCGGGVTLTLWFDLLVHKASLPLLLKVAKLMLLTGLRSTSTGSY
jgi:hypothetical protein